MSYDIFTETQKEVLYTLYRGVALMPEVHHDKNIILAETMTGTEVVPCDLLGLPDQPTQEEIDRHLVGGLVDPESLEESVSGYVYRLGNPENIGERLAWEYAEYTWDVYSALCNEASMYEGLEPPPEVSLVDLELEYETPDEQRQAGRYNPSRVLCYGGSRYLLGSGSIDTLTAYHDQRTGELLVFSYNSGLDYAALAVFNCEVSSADVIEASASVYLDNAEGMHRHLSDWDAVHLLAKLG